MNRTHLALSLIFVFALVATSCAQPYSVAWQKQFEPVSSESGSGVATDAGDNVFITGRAVEFSPGYAGTSSYAFLRKYDSAGTELWRRKVGGIGGNSGNAVTTDAVGNAYIAGSALLSAVNEYGVPYSIEESFVSKVDPTGNTLWTHTLDLPRNNGANALTIDPFGNIVVGGHVEEPVGLSHNNLPVSLVSKFDNAGNLLWSTKFGETNLSASNGVQTDSLGNIFVVGRTANDGYLKKLDGGGNTAWTRTFGEGQYGGPSGANGLAIDATNNLYITGPYITIVSKGTNGGPDVTRTDGYLTKLDGVGNPLWTQQFGSAQSGNGLSVALDAVGNAFVTGITNGDQPGWSLYANVYVGKFSGSGDPLWSTSFDSSNTDQGRAVALDGAGNIYIAGYTVGNLVNVNTGVGSEDAFLIKLALVPEPTTLALLAMACCILATRRRIVRSL